MMNGTVKNFYAQKGYGFLTTDGGEKVFFHIDELLPQTILVCPREYLHSRVLFYQKTDWRGRELDPPWAWKHDHLLCPTCGSRRKIELVEEKPVLEQGTLLDFELAFDKRGRTKAVNLSIIHVEN